MTQHDPGAVVLAEIGALQAQIGRADAKAAMLLATDGVLIALIGPTIATALPGGVAAAGWIAVAMLAASALVLLAAVYPMLPRLPGSLVDQAAMSAAQVAAAVTDSEQLLLTRAAQVPGLSRMALAKYRLIRASMWPLAGGLVLVVAAQAVAVLTR
jgi:hypothetical protein